MLKTLMNFLFLIIIFLSGCGNDPEPIQYGTDQCVHCRMTIMDNKFSAEIVTNKGKALKFDAAECMINYILENNFDENSASIFYVTDYNYPAKLINALSAAYIISSKIKSPMGENLTAFSGEKAAQKFLEGSGGEMYTWKTLTDKFRTGK